jgi:hypothetical protein
MCAIARGVCDRLVAWRGDIDAGIFIFFSQVGGREGALSSPVMKRLLSLGCVRSGGSVNRWAGAVCTHLLQSRTLHHHILLLRQVFFYFLSGTSCTAAPLVASTCISAGEGGGGGGIERAKS